MKMLKVNTTFEQDVDERRKFFAGLSYSERLRYYFKLRNTTHFHRNNYPKGRILRVSHSHDAD